MRSILDFVSLSAVLTGYKGVELHGTGLVQEFYNEVRDIVGGRIFGRLLLTWTEVRSAAEPKGLKADIEAGIEKRILRSPMLGPVARNIITLWYVGNWEQLPREWREMYGAQARDCTRVVSARPFQEGLVWRAIEAHPPTAKAPGFGTWAAAPTGAEVIDECQPKRAAGRKS